MSRHRVLFLSDLHAGSVWGLWPENYKADHDRCLPPSDAQKMLYAEWVRLCGLFKKSKPNTVILNGDIIDDPGYVKRGREQMTPDLNDQVFAAEELVRMALKAANPETVYALSRSDYHSSVQQDNERQLAKNLGVEYLGCGPHDLVFDGVSVNVSHGEGGVYWYRGTKLDKIGFAMLLGIAGEGLYDAKHIVRSHYHFEAHLHYRHQDIYVTPCFQMQTDFMRKKDPLKMIPNIGAMELTIEGGVVTPRFYACRHPPRPKTFVSGYSVHPEEAKKVRRIKKW